MDKPELFPILAYFLPIQTYFCIIRTKFHDIETSLSGISAHCANNLEQNEQFKNFLKQSDLPTLDQLVQQINNEVSALINCQQCGNCCKTLMIVVTEDEADRVSKSHSMKRIDFDTDYLEKGQHGLMLMNRIPCCFLKDDSCTVYENRFEGCREFPALHLDGFKKRLFTHFMHYERCPIIFNVMERLKIVLQFEPMTNTHD